MASTGRCIKLTVQKENQINEFRIVLSNERAPRVWQEERWITDGWVCIDYWVHVLKERKKIYLLMEYEPLL